MGDEPLVGWIKILCVGEGGTPIRGNHAGRYKTDSLIDSPSVMVSKYVFGGWS